MSSGSLSEVTMVLDSLVNIPHYEPPDGFVIRHYRPGDEPSWFKIQYEADKVNHITADLFGREFGSDVEAIRSRQLYAENEQGAAIGTVTAWFDNKLRRREWGRIHWMAVVPSLQGLGLGKALLSRACELLSRSGHNGAYLTTLPSRVAAMALYAHFGFRVSAGDELERPLRSTESTE
jgi:GNAT superfamily N-acetyltransferase